MPPVKENKEYDKDFKEVLVKVRNPEGKIEELAPAAADILCRKAGYVDVAKEAAAKKAAEEAAEKDE